MRLLPEDYEDLSKCFISADLADEVGLYRVSSIEGRDLIGRTGSGDFSGIVFPYRLPNGNGSRLDRLRLDAPPVDAATGKPLHKYLMPANARNRLYFPPCDTAMLKDISVPIILSEGEKKALALWRAALEIGNGTGRPTFFPVSIPGVWSWRGVTGTRMTADGGRVQERGVLSDFDLITWEGREAIIAFDANASTNPSVAAARLALAAELSRRGARVRIAEVPALSGINGVDDFLAIAGLMRLQLMIEAATAYNWRSELQISDRGKVVANLTNAITALRSAPEWCGLLAFDEFALRTIATRATPWGSSGTWSEVDDRLTCAWLQRHGIQVNDLVASQAVETVSRDRLVHPPREFLASRQWDRVARLDDWLIRYAGAEPSDLTRAFASKFLIGACARIFAPGSKMDCCLILEGPQGTFKSSLVRALFEPWTTDDIPTLGTKDASLTRLLLMGDAEAGGRKNPSQPPASSSIEGEILACCRADLAARILIAGHRTVHGGRALTR